MKLFFSSYDDIKNPYYGGGGAFAVHEIAKRLIPKHSVTVVTSRYPGSKNEVLEGVSYIRIGTQGKISAKLSQLVFQILLPIKVLITHHDVWFESFTPPFSTAFLPLYTRKPVVGITQLLAGREMSEKYKLPFYLLEKFGLSFYKNIVVLNESIKKQILKINNKIRVFVIPNGVNTNLANLEYEKNTEDIILFLGRIDTVQKGLDLLIKVFDLIKGQVKEDFIIAGGGLDSEIAKLNIMISEAGLVGRVKYVGMVQGSEKVELFKRAKIFVMTSRFEAFPLTMLEAFSYKVPVIYFNIDQLKFLPEDIAIKIEPENVNTFAEGLNMLIRNPELAKSLVLKAKEFVKNYTWDKIAEKYLRVINDLNNDKA